MLFSMNFDVGFPGETLLFYMVKGPSEVGLYFTGHIPHIFGPKEMVKQEHISIPSIYGPQCRFDIDKAGMFVTYSGHDVPNLAPVIHKVSSSVRHSCCHFLIDSFITIYRAFGFRLDLNVWVHKIIQCSPSYSIMRGNLLFDLLQSSWPILVINHRFFSSLLETNFMKVLVAIAGNQNQVDCIDNRPTLNPLHMFQIIHTKLQVSHCPNGDRYSIVTSGI
jgi:hypothetical protein